MLNCSYIVMFRVSEKFVQSYEIFLSCQRNLVIKTKFRAKSITSHADFADFGGGGWGRTIAGGPATGGFSASPRWQLKLPGL